MLLHNQKLITIYSSTPTIDKQHLVWIKWIESMIIWKIIFLILYSPSRTSVFLNFQILSLNDIPLRQISYPMFFKFSYADPCQWSEWSEPSDTACSSIICGPQNFTRSRYSLTNSERCEAIKETAACPLMNCLGRLFSDMTYYNIPWSYFVS